jgi:glyoxylase-like metal-dependent hydrolase (beta-lactamase superfamily II)
MAAPEEIVPGVYGVELGFVNAFFIADDAVTLIDTGLKSRAPRIETAVKETGRTLAEVKNIALTHHHVDHRGGVARLRSNETRVFAHPVDAEVVRGDRASPPPSTGGIQKVLLTVLGPLMRAPASAVDVEVTDGDVVPDTGGLRAVFTPGHTMGHISYLHPDKRLLFVGDATRNIRGLANTYGAFCEDVAEANRSIAKIAALDFDTAVFGHGKVLRGKANAEFRKLADRIAASG